MVYRAVVITAPMLCLKGYKVYSMQVVRNLEGDNGRLLGLDYRRLANTVCVSQSYQATSVINTCLTLLLPILLKSQIPSSFLFTVYCYSQATIEPPVSDLFVLNY